VILFEVGYMTNMWQSLFIVQTNSINKAVCLKDNSKKAPKIGAFLNH